MILIDTSAWVEFFRGKGRCANRVDEALEHNTAALCGPIVAELRRDLRSKKERNDVLRLLNGCRRLEQPPQLWEEAGDLGFALRAAGLTMKTLDLLIATYALAHQVPILTVDKDFARMQKAGLGIVVL